MGHGLKEDFNESASIGERLKASGSLNAFGPLFWSFLDPKGANFKNSGNFQCTFSWKFRQLKSAREEAPLPAIGHANRSAETVA